MMITNKQIAEGLRSSLKHLRPGNLEHTNYLTSCICFAVENEHGFNSELYNAIRDIIHERLGRWISVPTYIRNELNIPESEQTPENIQAYRHAWVHALIEEFSNKD
jgi:hypothetical protein